MNRTQLKKEIIEAFEKLQDPGNGDVGYHCDDCYELVKDLLLSQLNHALDEQEKAMKIEERKPQYEVKELDNSALTIEHLKNASAALMNNYQSEFRGGFNYALAEIETLKAEFNK